MTSVSAATIFVADGASVPLQSDEGLRLWFTIGVVAEPQEDASLGVRVASYLYALDDEAGREVLAYHWHRSGRSRIVRPHLHVATSGGALVDRGTHLPTGFVSFARVITLCVEEMHVKPARRDWETIVQQQPETRPSRSAFE